MIKKKRIGLKYKNKKMVIDVGECKGFNRIKGLMFTNKEKARALLFNFKKPSKLNIHSYFVFFSFIVVWLDDKNKVIEKKVAKPFTLSIKPRKSFTKLIEIPLTKKYLRIIELLDDDKKDL